MQMGLVWRDDPFMQTVLIGAEDDDHPNSGWSEAVKNFYLSIDHYNIHFLQHLWHAYAICGIAHPNETIRSRCWKFYLKGVHCLHMFPETPEQIRHRLRDGKREENE